MIVRIGTEWMTLSLGAVAMWQNQWRGTSEQSAAGNGERCQCLC
jgi:hypothetical protein